MDIINTNSYYKTCKQCPRTCNCNRLEGEKGFCGETDEIRISSACLHFGEEPLVTVYGGSGTIFFTGCNLHCAFCQNYQISQQGMGAVVSSDLFTDICLKLQNAGAENINLVTGSHIIPRLSTYLANAKKAGLTIPFCWNSSAYETTEMLELLKDSVSIWLPDLKTLNKDLSKKLFAAYDYPETAMNAITWMIKNSPAKFETITKNKKQKDKMLQGVIIRHLFLPGNFEDTADVLDWLKHNADKKACISLMSQYTPVPFKDSEKALKKRKEALSSIQNRLVNKTEDMDIRDLIDAYDFDYLFYQELSDDTSWLPDFTKNQPFSNALAHPVWFWKEGFI